ncbi:hypothetical protein CRYUN_Cryun08bG0154500 [Craigia yunnanensis]
MKERQHWRTEEDALLRAYVKQYGPREWNLVSQHMNTPLNRDVKSCSERWNNYLKPGIKKGSLTEEEHHLVIRLHAKHGNKWKKITVEVLGRTAKRLGKWWEPERISENTLVVLGNMVPHRTIPPCGENLLVSELVECCKKLEEGHHAWVAHKKEAAWRLRRVELQLESEKACRRREKVEEIESKVKALREEQKVTLDRIQAEYREQLEGLKRDAEAKKQKLAEQWITKHLRLTKFLEQMGCRPRLAETNGR